MSLIEIVKSAGRKIGKGLAIGGAVVASWMPISADAGAIYIKANSSVGNPDLDLRHITGATEVLDAYDSEFLSSPTPAIDFYSDVSFDPYKLTSDSRGPDSLSTIFAKIEGRGLSNPVDVDLDWLIWQPGGEDNFVGKPMYADLFDENDTPLGTYNIRDLDAGTETFPTLSVDNGLSYKLDVRFTEASAPIPEPSALALLAMGGAALARRKTREGIRSASRRH